METFQSCHFFVVHTSSVEFVCVCVFTSFSNWWWYGL